MINMIMHRIPGHERVHLPLCSVAHAPFYSPFIFSREHEQKIEKYIKVGIKITQTKQNHRCFLVLGVK